MTYATTFSGIGGWEIGLNACGWNLKWQCECDKFCRAVLKQRYGVPIAPDIKSIIEWLSTEFGSIESAKIDVLIGSPPCQPFSAAGKKRGVGDERHLYPAFIHAISILQPRYVLMENVAGLLSDRWAFGQYIGGLAALGYDIVWHCIPACAVGLPHRRDRVWIIANANGERCERRIQRIGEIKRDRHAEKDLHTSALELMRAGNDLPSPRICRRSDGIPNFRERIKALGNAVVPQIPYIIGQAINEFELMNP